MDELSTREQTEDAISRQAVDEAIYDYSRSCDVNYAQIMEYIDKIPSVNPQPKTGHCKDCKYFEYNSAAKVDGIPLIVAHEICKRWGDGCKTSENGYCFLFEQQESEGV
jgi:hypothetical protein